MAIDLERIERSKELKALKKEIAALEKKSLKFVADAADEANALKRAKNLTDRLKAALTYTGRQCPPGTVWDAETKTCM
ncbi:MAG TPA: hypothetical protein PKY59_13765 [Pyrinomonadaceae bacterium]|nr:hypothetical protein [Pyrinomonadaceae bacterium]